MDAAEVRTNAKTRAAIGPHGQSHPVPGTHVSTDIEKVIPAAEPFSLGIEALDEEPRRHALGTPRPISRGVHGKRADEAADLDDVSGLAGYCEITPVFLLEVGFETVVTGRQNTRLLHARTSLRSMHRGRKTRELLLRQHQVPAGLHRHVDPVQQLIGRRCVKVLSAANLY